MLNNDNIKILEELYLEHAPKEILIEALKIVKTPFTKGFYYSRKLNALLDLNVKAFNKVVFEFLKTTDLPVGKLENFPLIENEDVLVKDDIFRLLEESGDRKSVV